MKSNLVGKHLVFLVDHVPALHPHSKVRGLLGYIRNTLHVGRLRIEVPFPLSHVRHIWSCHSSSRLPSERRTSTSWIKSSEGWLQSCVIKEHARELGLLSLERAQGDLTSEYNYVINVVLYTWQGKRQQVQTDNNIKTQYKQVFHVYYSTLKQVSDGKSMPYLTDQCVYLSSLGFLSNIVISWGSTSVVESHILVRRTLLEW